MDYRFYLGQVFLLIISGLVCLDCNEAPMTASRIKGIYGHPQPIWDQGYQLTDLGINAIFVHSGSISQELIDRVKKEGLKIYAEFATLNGKGYVEEHPEAWAISENGEKVEAASWFMGVCPTEPGFRLYRRNQLEALLLEYHLDGVWLDYVHWHAQFEDPEPILPETCFCDHCLEIFSKDKKIKIPSGTTSAKANFILDNHNEIWRDWRCEIIYAWTEEMRHILKSIQPEALLGLYHCPWSDDDFGGARREILGLDYKLLRNSIDVFSPMVYHARMGKEPEWVEKNLQWFYSTIQIKDQDKFQVWPIVQAHNDPYEISAEEFGEVLSSGLQDPSSGVMMFTSRSIAEDLKKIEVMQQIYLAH